MPEAVLSYVGRQQHGSSMPAALQLYLGISPTQYACLSIIRHLLLCCVPHHMIIVQQVYVLFSTGIQCDADMRQ